MTVIGLTSAKGSPGVTTTAVALATVWPDVHPGRRVLLAECDPAGADIANGYLQGALDGTRGLLGLATRRDPDPIAAMWSQLLSLDEAGDRLLLPGVVDPNRTAAATGAWAVLESALDGLSRQDPPVDVVVDLGRLRSAHDPAGLRGRADPVVFVTGSSLPAVVAARSGAALLRDTLDPSVRLGCVVVGPRRPYPAVEVAEAIGLPPIGEIPYDPGVAAVYSEGRPGGRRAGRSPLLRAVRSLAAVLLENPADRATAADGRTPVGGLP